MRKFIMTALAASVALPVIMVPTIASAQSAGEVRHDQREIRKDQREIHRDQRRGDWREARQDRHELRQDRQEMREDWRDYRNAHRDAFRRPAYVGPRGYAYRPVVTGYRFQPAYYGNRYWVRDYARYRLPEPGRFHRWVRYGNDVVLVDVRSGHVVRVYNGFFF